MDSRGTPANWRPSAISGHLLTTIRQLFSHPGTNIRTFLTPTKNSVFNSGSHKSLNNRQEYGKPQIHPIFPAEEHTQFHYHLICPVEKHIQFKFVPYMPNRKVYPVQDFTLYGQPKTIPYSTFHPICPAEEYSCLFALSRSQRHGSSSLWCRHPSSSPSCPCS